MCSIFCDYNNQILLLLPDFGRFMLSVRSLWELSCVCIQISRASRRWPYLLWYCSTRGLSRQHLARSHCPPLAPPAARTIVMIHDRTRYAFQAQQGRNGIRYAGGFFSISLPLSEAAAMSFLCHLPPGILGAGSPYGVRRSTASGVNNYESHRKLTGRWPRGGWERKGRREGDLVESNCVRRNETDGYQNRRT
jgi:hypothetical protein